MDTYEEDALDTNFNLAPDHVIHKPTWRQVWTEFVAIIDFASFMFASAIFYFMMFPISLIFVGQLGTLYLDAVGLGNTFFNVFGILVFNGVMTGVDTTMAQSYGTTNKKMVGIYYQKGLIMYNLVLLVCVAILINSETLLVLLGQNREVARLSGMYVSNLSIAIFFFAIWNITTRYFRIQNVIWLNFVALSCQAMISLLCHYVFIRLWGWGIQGSAIAQIVAYGSGAGITLIITPFQRKTLARTWGGFSREAWQDWGTFSVLSFSGLFIICLQWWGLEICTLLSGLLGEVELAAQAILFQVNNFIYIVPLAMGIATNVLIGQHVGANNPMLGKLNMQLGWLVTWTLSAIAIMLLLTLSDYIPAIFSDDVQVGKLVSETLPYLAIYHVFDSTVSTSLGMCRGVARQKMGAVVSFIGMYVVGMPLAYYLTFFQDMSLAGLWIGPASGLALETAALLFFLSRTKWKKECDDAQIRAGLDPNKNETRFSSDADDETTLLLPDKRAQRSKRYGPELSSSQIDLSVLRTGTPLSTSQLVLRRGATVMLCFGILIIGVVLHFDLVLEYPVVILNNATKINITSDT